MPTPSRRRPTARAIALLVAASAALALLLAEVLLRAFPPRPRVLGSLSYALADGTPVTFPEALEKGLIVPVPGPRPMDRPRFMFRPNQRFFLCYADNDVLRRDWLDAEGRVLVRINHSGLRERDEIQPQKPVGERRIVCIGDSFTFAWGIPEELGWVRRLENELRAGGANVRTVNCGASGTVCIDEYWFGLQHRFHAFDPDAVILTICLNDLVPSSGLSLIAPPPTSSLRLLDLVRQTFGRGPLDLDPARDWVQELLDLPPDQARAAGLTNHDRPAEALWSTGVPQQSLREAKAWCDQRGLPFLVVLWPFLQGLGPGRHYPFQKLHDLVAAECAAAGIPFLDVLPALRGTNAEDLWVTPADMHANPRAQELATPAIVAKVRELTRW
jgi:lysophospholipase L1-like esterase